MSIARLQPQSAAECVVATAVRFHHSRYFRPVVTITIALLTTAESIAALMCCLACFKAGYTVWGISYVIAMSLGLATQAAIAMNEAGTAGAIWSVMMIAPLLIGWRAFTGIDQREKASCFKALQWLRLYTTLVQSTPLAVLSGQILLYVAIGPGRTCASTLKYCSSICPKQDPTYHYLVCLQDGVESWLLFGFEKQM